MKARDAVMSPKRTSEIIPGIKELYPNQQFVYCSKCSTELLEAQAEISFKAGVREVVEFYKQEQIKRYGYPLSLDANWQAKLKEWGVG